MQGTSSTVGSSLVGIVVKVVVIVLVLTKANVFILNPTVIPQQSHAHSSLFTVIPRWLLSPNARVSSDEKKIIPVIGV